MRIVLLGAPGSGKSTIAQKIAQAYGFPVISVEQVAEELSTMAKEDDDMGRLARESIGAGRVSDDVCNVVVQRVLGKPEQESGFVLVGYPKDASQAEFIENSMNEMQRPLDLVMMIDIDRDELMERRVGRINCDSCGEQYNLYVNPPMVEGICDVCGSRVNRRPKGYEENISNQLREYDLVVENILDFFREKGKLRLVDGNGSEEELWENVRSTIDNTAPAAIPEPPAPKEPPKPKIKSKPAKEGKSAGKKKTAVKKKTSKKKTVKKKTAPAKSAKKKVSKKKAAKKKTSAAGTAKTRKKTNATKKKAAKKTAATAKKKTAAKKKASKKKAAKKKTTAGK